MVDSIPPLKVNSDELIEVLQDLILKLQKGTLHAIAISARIEPSRDWELARHIAVWADNYTDLEHLLGTAHLTTDAVTGYILAYEKYAVQQALEDQQLDEDMTELLLKKKFDGPGS